MILFRRVHLSILINGKSYESLHFIGIFGSGMSALAQYCVWNGIKVSGSDRLFNTNEVSDIQNKLIKAGCSIFPQNGSGCINADAVVISTAIEDSNPDIIQARKNSIPIFHRSDILATIVSQKKTIAVAGTSGKSTVTAMIWEFLFGCAKDASLITGAPLIYLEEKGLIGNAYKGSSDLLVIEADESDGSCIKYMPYISVFLNVSKDHKTIKETLSIFNILAKQSEIVITNSDDPRLKILNPKRTFGANGTFFPDSVISVIPKVAFVKGENIFSCPIPGIHNLSNLLAAICVCDLLGCSDSGLIKSAANFRGVKRRFAISYLSNNIKVIDDYAHNPEKIKAAIQTAKGFSKRILAIFQPHGFGPLKFFKNELVNTFSESLNQEDILFLLPVYYAGGTVKKDISSLDIAIAVNKKNKKAIAFENREALIKYIKEAVIPDDAILVMGARDPSLSELANNICKEIG